MKLKRFMATAWIYHFIHSFISFSYLLFFIYLTVELWKFVLNGAISIILTVYRLSFFLKD